MNNETSIVYIQRDRLWGIQERIHGPSERNINIIGSTSPGCYISSEFMASQVLKKRRFCLGFTPKNRFLRRTLNCMIGLYYCVTTSYRFGGTRLFSGPIISAMFDEVEILPI